MYRKTTRGHSISPTKLLKCDTNAICSCAPFCDISESRRLRTRYLKSADESDELENLQKIFAFISNRYTSGILGSEEAPRSMLARLEADLTTFDRTMASSLAKAAMKISANSENLSVALEEIAPVFEQNISRLSNILYAHDVEMRSYLALEAARGSSYLFISEHAGCTCGRCEALHGRVFSPLELQGEGVIPPLHPCCKCTLVELDIAELFMYNFSGTALLRES